MSESTGLSLDVSPELFEALAQRTAEILAEHNGAVAENDGWLRGAEKIAAYIDAPKSRVYALANCQPSRIPVDRDGSALIARRSELDLWVRNGGGKRP